MLFHLQLQADTSRSYTSCVRAIQLTSPPFVLHRCVRMAGRNVESRRRGTKAVTLHDETRRLFQL